MNIDKAVERKVICAVDKDYINSGRDVGKLKVFYEVLPSGEAVPINSTELFCETERVFVIGVFSELKDKFGDRLFEAVCSPSVTEYRIGECRYITRLSSCSEIKGLSFCQIYDEPLPSVSSSVFTSSRKPITKNILLRNDGALFGPFECFSEFNENTESYNHTIHAISTPLPSIPSFHIGKVSLSLVSKNINEDRGDGYPILLGNVKRCFESAELIDYITDEQIISFYGTKVAQNGEIRSFSKGTVSQIRAVFAKTIDYKKFPERFKRFFEALEAAHNWEGTRKDIIDSFINTSAGKSVLENYIESNKEQFFKLEKQNYLAQLKEDNEILIKDFTSQKEKIRVEIQELKRERQDAMDSNVAPTTITKLSTQQQEKIEILISDKRRQLDELHTQVAGLAHTYSKFKDLDAITQEIKDLGRDRDTARDALRTMNGQVDEVAEKLRKSNDQLTARLLDLKPHVDALSGIAPKPQAAFINYTVSVAQPDENMGNDDLREKLIDDVLEDLNSLGRKTDYNSVANIITTIAQSQFTLFSGRPGTGKTSLAKMLGSTLGLNNRLLNIPVARGWTSSRDVIGFYNALSSSFNPAATGLYELLNQLDKEQKSGMESAPAICLLDEFNLSQPEHYFSPFLEMADPESKRTIATGDCNTPYLEIPNYLRFLGTINNDESVQSLTPRMIDRSAIISFDEVEPDFDITLNTGKNSINVDKAKISGNKFLEIFAPRSLELPPEVENTLKQIVEILRMENPELGIPVSVSFRKIKAIRAYYNVASSLYIDSRFVAMDYAVSQHVIPLLTGYGHNFGKRLNRMLDLIPSDMNMSRKMLSRIIENGNQNMFTYGYNI